MSAPFIINVQEKYAQHIALKISLGASGAAIFISIHSFTAIQERLLVISFCVF